jgi:HEAT repeat protein
MRASASSAGRRLGLLIGALLAAPSAARAADVADLVLRLRAPDAEVVQAATRALAALGPEAAPEILGLCSGTRADAGLLAPGERELLLAPLRAWPREVAVRALLAAVPPEAGLDERLTALALLGEVGGQRAIAALDALVRPLPDEARVHPRLSEELERALTQVLARDVAASAELEQRIQRGELAHEILQPAAVALGRTGRGRGLGALERLLGRTPELDAAVLRALGELRPFDDPRARLQAGRTLRRRLTAPDPELRRQAAFALGRLRDGEAVPELLALLDDSERRVQRAAAQALGQIARLDPTALDTAGWQRWFEGELTWLESEGDAQRLELAADEPARVVAALRVLASHPLHAHALAEEVQALLPHEEALVAEAACAALVRLDDVTAFEPLLETLADGRAPVRASALAALRALTGADLGPAPSAWRAWLEPARP